MVFVFVDDYIDLVLVIVFVYLDVIINLECKLIEMGIYLVVDLLVFILRVLELLIVG